MNKPKKLQGLDSRIESEEVDARLIELPKPRVYAPPSCTLCSNDRPKGMDYTRVYKTHRVDGFIIRYCRCDFCGNTYKDSVPISTGVESSL
jgi:hypothetical protein